MYVIKYEAQIHRSLAQQESVLLLVCSKSHRTNFSKKTQNATPGHSSCTCMNRSKPDKDFPVREGQETRTWATEDDDPSKGIENAMASMMQNVQWRFASLEGNNLHRRASAVCCGEEGRRGSRSIEGAESEGRPQREATATMRRSSGRAQKAPGSQSREFGREPAQACARKDALPFSGGPGPVP